MKSDFMMAINQVCHERQLSLETVMEAVEVALVSAYKRNYGGNTVTAKIDANNGAIKIFVEKEVVEEVLDPKNEISPDHARVIDAQAQIGDVVFMEDTPANFGRIAAQTTKQVILQRIREAERDALYNVYVEREGEIVNGTVHKVDASQVILSLGKVEAILPKSEQIPTETYSEGQRLRAYVAEVTKTPRGPQIIVSRTHRNMLRRLLEVEVPEIYNGTVEIKAIAREAGYRSKVAVSALQEGVDPVGSCVGMRGVRIQSIVNELGGEKIDVAQWSPDTTVFIANALSPAKVLNVILQDLNSNKTAMVVVPDKQLSLAIGKEGQNARLAAKLTSWRIDIKSAIEAAEEALARASASEEIKALVLHRPEVFSLASAILAEREEGKELSQGELQLLSVAIELVGQAELTVARQKREAEIAARHARRAQVVNQGVDLLAEAEAILAETAPQKPVEDAILEEIQAVEAEILRDDIADLEAEVDIEAIARQFFAEGAETEPIALDTPLTEAPELGSPESAIEKVAATEEVEARSDEVEFIPSILGSLVAEPEPVKKPPKKKLNVYLGSDEPELQHPAAAKKRARPKGRTSESGGDFRQFVGKRKRKKSGSGDNLQDDLDDDY